MISAIVAVDENWGIGFNGELLEKIPEEMKYFNRTAYVKEQIVKEFTEVNDDIAQSISDQFIEKTF